MKTIEERAEYYADNNFRSDREWRAIKHSCFMIATEQDRIARVEERERCIKAAQEYCCKRCRVRGVPERSTCNTCKKIGSFAGLRKAMEGGEV